MGFARWSKRSVGIGAKALNAHTRKWGATQHLMEPTDRFWDEGDVGRWTDTVELTAEGND